MFWADFDCLHRVNGPDTGPKLHLSIAFGHVAVPCLASCLMDILFGGLDPKKTKHQSQIAPTFRPDSLDWFTLTYVQSLRHLKFKLFWLSRGNGHDLA